MKWPLSGYNLLIGELMARQRERSSGWAVRCRASPGCSMLGMGPAAPSKEPACVLLVPLHPRAGVCRDAGHVGLSTPVLGQSSRALLRGCLHTSSHHQGHSLALHSHKSRQWGTDAWERAQPTNTMSALAWHSLHITPALWGVPATPSPSGRPLAPARRVPAPGGGHRPVSSGRLARAKQLGSACLLS